MPAAGCDSGNWQWRFSLDGFLECTSSQHASRQACLAAYGKSANCTVWPMNAVLKANKRVRNPVSIVDLSVGCVLFFCLKYWLTQAILNVNKQSAFSLSKQMPFGWELGWVTQIWCQLVTAIVPFENEFLQIPLNRSLGQFWTFRLDRFRTAQIKSFGSGNLIWDYCNTEAVLYHLAMGLF